MPDRALTDLAAAWGIQTSYRDVTGAHRRASPDALYSVLRALGADVEHGGDVDAALRARREQIWSRTIEPVTVVWDDEDAAMIVRCDDVTSQLRFEIETEQGETVAHVVDVRDHAPIEKADGRTAVRVPLPPLPHGYHHVRGSGSGMIVRAPARVHAWPGRGWGVFMPLHAVRTSRDHGAGDLTDLAALLSFVERRGGDLVATLPLLARFDDEPSPYSPITRLFWDERWLDLDEFANDQDRAEIERLRASPAVDHRALGELKRRILARAGSSDDDASRDDELDAYARFRAAVEAHGHERARWPSDALERVDDDAVRIHLRAQRFAEKQLRALDRSRASLLFDLPLGVHPNGFDTWRHPDAFALDAHGGAPPDSFFTKGQDWAFPPLHPERLRETRYAYPIAALRALMRHARAVRIDHVMGFHRMWWIPAGADATDGAYVRGHPDEWYGILALESARARCAVVGEDLGTVPRDVRRAMSKRGLLRIYVVQEELRPDPADALNPVPRQCVATINTHDMPMFAAFWRGLDIDRRVTLGLFDDEEARAERERRASLRVEIARTVGSEPDERSVLEALLVHLGQSMARIVVPNLEDFWGETEPQNIPGTTDGNWVRKGRYTLEELSARPEIGNLLDALTEARRS